MADTEVDVESGAGFRPGGFHHVAIFAEDYDAAVAFYRDVFGLRQRIEWGEDDKRATMLDVGGGAHVEIFERRARGEVPTGMQDRVSIAHFCLRVDDTAAALEKARAAGCPIEMELKSVTLKCRLGGPDATIHIGFFTGPSGELVELFQSDVL
jgi:glyoxylase I family protein